MSTNLQRFGASAVVAALLAAGALVPAATPVAQAADTYQRVPLWASLKAGQYSAHRSYLRPGCKWDVFGRGLQHCQVYSRSMKRTIPVEIMPAKTAGNSRMVMALDGLGNNNDHNGFIFAGNLQGALANYDVTLVAPISGDYAAGTYYTDYAAPLDNGKTIRWETFLTRELPRYLATHFHVPVRRRSTALVGLSMGAVGIMNLAQRYPSRYAAVNSMSGFYTLSAPLQAGVMALGSRMMGYQPQAMWGNWPGGQWKAHDPSLNISRYSMPVRVSCGNGTALNGSELPYFEVIAEVASNINTRDFRNLVERSTNRKRFTFRIADKGGHNWAFWNDDLYGHGGLAFLLQALRVTR